MENPAKSNHIKEDSEIDPLYIMDEIIDKLKILDYETNFLKQKINKPLSRTYFASKSVNNDDQFIYFATLCIWLLNLIGSNIQGDKKYDDPLTTSQNILLEIKNLGIDLNIPPNKLRLGYGEYICLVLITLVNKAVEKKKKKFKKTKAESNIEKNNDLVDIEDDIPDDINKDINYNDENNLDNENNNNNEDEIDDDKRIIKPEVNRRDWLRECDRVSSKLKIDYDKLNSFSSISSEWRHHIEQLRNNDATLINIIPSCRNGLETLSEEIQRSLEKINKQETSLTKNFSQIPEFKKPKVMNEHLDEFNNLRGNVDKLQKDVEELDEKIVELKNNMDKVNNPAMANKMKASISKISQEALSYDLKNSIVNCSIYNFLQTGLSNVVPESYDDGEDLFDENF